MKTQSIGRLSVVCAATLVAMGCSAEATKTSLVGHILDPIGGCSAVGAWNMVKLPDGEGRVRFELLVGSTRSVSEFEVDCGDLGLRQTANIQYDRAGEPAGRRATANAVPSAQLAPALKQVCAISRGEAGPAHGTFTSVAEFREKSAAMPPDYFAAQPACLTYSGPPTVTRPGD